MKILVTGAAGFLGGRMAKGLRAAGHQVTATSRRSNRREEFEKRGIRFEAGDLTDAGFAQTVSTNHDAIVHCAALSSPWGNYADFAAANIGATESLLNAARQNQIARFVNIGTPSIYINYSNRLAVKESDPLPARAVNFYAHTKRIAEDKVLSAHHSTLFTVSLRPRAIIGAEDQVVFPRMIRAYHEKKLRIVGRSDVKVHLTCAVNIVHAVERALTVPHSVGGTAYNIADAAPVFLWEEVNYVLNAIGLSIVTGRIPLWLAESVATLSEWKSRITGREPVLHRYGINAISRDFTLDISRAREMLGYNPPMSSRDGLNEFIEWYKSEYPAVNRR